MTVMVSDSRVMTMEEMAAFLVSSETLSFRGETRQETYAWVENTLRKYRYTLRSRAEKGRLRRYVGKMTGYSRCAPEAGPPEGERAERGVRPGLPAGRQAGSTH
ncbi:MAG TPA: hypothetical protein P5259_00010 [Candidatus Bipolaricaulis sp.]|nr:hypothetical protein [Candidatus Bipolaricaulis sp.]HRU22182.1 hypothetical protein [Candidatus Bipolaricaulis sp.]